MNIHRTRLAQLRASMKKHDIDAYVIFNTDPHIGEYVPDHWKIVPWLTGFTGSSAIVIVAKKFAGLWTDSRYLLQAGQQLSGSGFLLRKINVPGDLSWVEWLAEKTKNGGRIGTDGRIFSIKDLEKLKKALKDKKVDIDVASDLISDIWTDRPSMPFSIAFDHDIVYAGKDRKTKILEVREQMHRRNINWHLLTSVDDIMWLLNIRGKDLEYSPLLYSFSMIGPDQVLLFTDETKIPFKLAMEFDKTGITILPYDEISTVLSRLKKGSSLLITPETTNTYLFSAIVKEVRIIQEISIPARLKAVKNQTETGNIRRVMVKDGAALTKFFFWLEKNIDDQNITETSAAEKLNSFRLNQSDCTGSSFAPITAYREHGALVHYNANRDSDYLLRREGLFLVDSGGQYLDGTTDITRTISLGLPDKQQISDFTFVLKGFIRLAMARFPEGTKGYQLDALARQPLWNNGLNYGHGTGHGVGFFLNVHEGPFSIGTDACNKQQSLVPGLIISDEPAIYREKQYGIRTENLLLVTQSCKTEFGQFLNFETLSMCYIDTKLIDKSLMEPVEIKWLNNYHSIVYEKLALLLTGEERLWLRDKTAEI
jgi:Xaa-Pro aminopeptidase